MYNELHQVFEDALKDFNAANLDGETYKSRMAHGIKIVKYDEDDSVVIYNTAKGGDYYEEISEEEYTMFFNDGWELSVCNMCLTKYTNRLKVIEEKIKLEINGRNNSKYLDFLKETRKETLKRYYIITQKKNNYEN